MRVGEPEQGSVIGKKVGAIRFGVYASREYLDKHAQFQSPDEMDGHYIIAAKGALAKTKQAVEFDRLTESCKTVLSTDNLFVQLAAIKDGLGVAPLPRYLGDPTPDLIEMMPGVLQSTTSLWVLTHPDIKDFARIKQVTSFLIDACNLE